MDEIIIRDEVGYNRQDPTAGPVVGFAAAILVTLVLVFIFVIAYYGWALEAEQYRFQMLPVAQDYKTIQAANDKLLHQYVYANKERTAVHVPVERAMEILLKESAAKKTFYSTAPAAVPAPAAAAAPAMAAPAMAAPGAAAPAAAHAGAPPVAHGEAPKH